MNIGVLALQGDFSEHIAMLKKIGVETTEVRLPKHLEGLSGLIIPGGESTTIAKLATAFGLMEPLRQFAQTRAVWGTCAGAIFLAKDIGRADQPILGVMDIKVQRNAFGRQVDSFETDLVVEGITSAEDPYHAVFIRAPIIEEARGNVKILCALADGRIVAAREGRLLATSFHPELTQDTRFHQYFVEMAN